MHLCVLCKFVYLFYLFYVYLFTEPVSIRSSNSNNFFPQPSLYSQELETMFSITCNSLPGNGNLKWTTDAEDLVNDLSQLPSDSGSVISVSPTELRLELTTLAYSETSGNLTCTSLDSGLSATVFLPGSKFFSWLKFVCRLRGNVFCYKRAIRYIYYRLC